jgi:hypothetical protein
MKLIPSHKVWSRSASTHLTLAGNGNTLHNALISKLSSAKSSPVQISAGNKQVCRTRRSPAKASEISMCIGVRNLQSRPIRPKHHKRLAGKGVPPVCQLNRRHEKLI